MDSKQRRDACDLRRNLKLVEHSPQLASQGVSELVHALVDLWSQLVHDDFASSHSQRIAVESPRVPQDRPALGGVEKGHDVLAATERPDWRAAADYLAHRREVWRYAEQFLRAARRDSEALHLVEYQENAILAGYFSYPFQEVHVRGKVAEAG